MQGFQKFLLQDDLRVKVLDRYRESNLRLAIEYLGDSIDLFPPFDSSCAMPCTQLPIQDLKKNLQLYNKHIKSSAPLSSPSPEKADETFYIESIVRQLDAVYNTRSWKITAPLRTIFNKINKIKGKR